VLGYGARGFFVLPFRRFSVPGRLIRIRMQSFMEPDAPFLKRVKSTILKHQMIQSGDRVVVAVSGGPDSVCLLDVLSRLREAMPMSLFVAHLNHGLRPDEDQRETEFVNRLAASRGLPCRVGCLSHLRLSDPSLEDKARDSRYRFLEEARRAFSAQKTALGHTLTDQAETFVMRLLRGSGSHGMGAIPPRRDNRFIRPLIEIPRDHILSYLARRGLDFMEDSSNRDPRFLRNRVREALFPVLKSFQPKAVEILGHTADLLREDETWLAEKARDWVTRASLSANEEEVRLRASAVAALPPALMNRVIRYAVSLVKGGLWGISSRHVASVRGLAMSRKASAMVNLPGEVTARRVYGQLILTRFRKEEADPFSYRVERPGTYRLERLGCAFRFQELEGPGLFIRPPSANTAFFDAEKIAYPLVIRNVRPGDRFVPHGMAGRKKLKEFFIDRKIPREMRSRLPLLVQGEAVLWVCGHRTDDRFRVRPETRLILRVDLMEQVKGIKEVGSRIKGEVDAGN
jgi:tRNA(Ile)-lysidine synthase